MLVKDYKNTIINLFVFSCFRLSQNLLIWFSIIYRCPRISLSQTLRRYSKSHFQFLGGSQSHTCKLKSCAKALDPNDLDELLNFAIILKFLKKYMRMMCSMLFISQHRYRIRGYCSIEGNVGCLYSRRNASDGLYILWAFNECIQVATVKEIVMDDIKVKLRKEMSGTFLSNIISFTC